MPTSPSIRLALPPALNTAEALCPGLSGHLAREGETHPGDGCYPAPQTRPLDPGFTTVNSRPLSPWTEAVQHAWPSAPKFTGSARPPVLGPACHVTNSPSARNQPARGGRGHQARFMKRGLTRSRFIGDCGAFRFICPLVHPLIYSAHIECRLHARHCCRHL